MKGLVFAIEEMAVHDGPGLRTAVFLKGCPLRCQWCHNPEGWTMHPQRVRNRNGCRQCGACETECAAHCTGCGKCLYRCPADMLRISGKWWDAPVLAQRIRMNEPLLREGGVTLSGGEVLMQAEFAAELLDWLAPLHRAIETSGFGSEPNWRMLLTRVELVYFDIKLADSERHRFYTGADNACILRNLEILKRSGVPFVIRIPTIRGVNDDAENMRATCALLSDAPALQGVELLPYNTYAGAKYALLDMPYPHGFEPPTQTALDAACAVFAQAGIPVSIRRQTDGEL